MGSLHLALITLISPTTIFSPSSLFISEVQQTSPHSSCFARQVKCFQFSCHYFVHYISFSLHSSFSNRCNQNYTQRRFHKYDDIKIFLSLLEKKKGIIGIALAFFTVRSHWGFIIILWATDIPSYFSIYFQPACSGGKKIKILLAIEIYCNHNVAFCAISITVDLKVIQFFHLKIAWSHTMMKNTFK